MIDIQKMYTSISKIRHIFGDDVRATQSLGEVFELITRLREAERDAARYRFMRDSGKFLESGEEFDAAIDQAMKEKCDE